MSAPANPAGPAGAPAQRPAANTRRATPDKEAIALLPEFARLGLHQITLVTTGAQAREAAAALAEQISGWTRVERMAARGSRELFLAALDKVPAAEPAPEDRI